MEDTLVKTQREDSVCKPKTEVSGGPAGPFSLKDCGEKDI
jgi:hypothetical protein